jgi:hypothetical protein
MLISEKAGYINSQPMMLVSGDTLITPKKGVRASILGPSVNDKGEIAVTLNVFKDMAQYNKSIELLSFYGEPEDECPKGMILEDTMVVFLSRQQLAQLNFPAEHLAAKRLTFTASLGGNVDKLSIVSVAADFSTAVEQDTRTKNTAAPVAKVVSLKDSTFATFQEAQATWKAMKADATADPKEVATAEEAVKAAKSAALAVRTA